MPGHSAQLVALGLGHLAPVIGRAGGETLLSLSDAALRELSAACLEVAVVRSLQQRSGAAPVARSAHVDESASDLAPEERSEERDNKEEAAAELEGGQEQEVVVLETVKKHPPLCDLALRLGQIFVDHIGPWLDPVDIARLAITCKWDRERICLPLLKASGRNANLLNASASRDLSQLNQDNLPERLYKQVCNRLGFKQTGSTSRPVPWVKIFEQHLCVECWQPAVSSGSIHVDLNGGSGLGGHTKPRLAVKWLCGGCRKTVKGLQTSELKSKGLPQTAQRFEKLVWRKILYYVV